jgi:hypothetical protein
MTPSEAKRLPDGRTATHCAYRVVGVCLCRELICAASIDRCELRRDRSEAAPFRGGGRLKACDQEVAGPVSSRIAVTPKASRHVLNLGCRSSSTTAALNVRARSWAASCKVDHRDCEERRAQSQEAVRRHFKLGTTPIRCFPSDIDRRLSPNRDTALNRAGLCAR